MKHKTLKSYLECAKGIIEKGWCQGDYAQTRSGMGVAVEDPKATKFCMIGALKRCDESSDFYFPARQALRAEIEMRPISSFNDDMSRKKSQVLAVFDRAIKAA